MKASLALLTLIAGALAAPLEGHHHHAHQHKRNIVTEVVWVDGNGHTVPAPTASDISPVAATTSAPSVQQQPTTEASSVPTTLSTAYSSSSVEAPSSASDVPTSSGSGSPGLGGIAGDLSAFEDPSQDFEDGKYSCDSVPTGQGVIAIDWIEGLTGGWSSIMNEQGQTSSSCQDGYYCSYACQAGMAKTQWPSQQPLNGISVGGLQCKNGKLYRANQDKSTLCEWGAKTASFKSQISKPIAICKTDYPGSENMNIPTLLEAGGSSPATVVDSGDYYKWLGGKTSSQYYVNNAGISAEEGCLWGNSSSTVGNWAPVVLGAGQTDGNTYLSLIPNPNNNSPPNYSVKIIGTPGSNVVGQCSYENGKYNGGSGSDGCTVTVTKGEAQFVFF